jgi:hypothetical protein
MEIGEGPEEEGFNLRGGLIVNLCLLSCLLARLENPAEPHLPDERA